MSYFASFFVSILPLEARDLVEEDEAFEINERRSRYANLTPPPPPKCRFRNLIPVHALFPRRRRADVHH
jgi:hypothetical protein